MGTKTKLVEDLQNKPRSLARDALIERAKAGFYHDFESDQATPKLQLHRDLKKAGFHNLAEKAKRGVYDDDPTEKQIQDALDALEMDAKGRQQVRRRSIRELVALDIKEASVYVIKEQFGSCACCGRLKDLRYTTCLDCSDHCYIDPTELEQAKSRGTANGVESISREVVALHLARKCKWRTPEYAEKLRVMMTEH